MKSVLLKDVLPCQEFIYTHQDLECKFVKADSLCLIEQPENKSYVIYMQDFWSTPKYAISLWPNDIKVLVDE